MPITSFLKKSQDFQNLKVNTIIISRILLITQSKFNGKIKNATISQLPSGKYYVSILVDTEVVKYPVTDKKIGLDLGIKDLCITSNGEKYENPKTINKYEKRLARLGRSLARKVKGSKNFLKTNRKLAKCYEKISNIRRDYLHKVSHEIISENQVIVTENLQVKNMMQNHKLASSISAHG